MRLAIITGGSTGLGLALCRQCAEQGYQLVEFSRRAPHPFSVRVDLAQPVKSRQTVRRAIAALAPEALTELLVVSNAGTLAPIGPVAKKPRAAVLANLNTNSTSAILVLAEIIARFQQAPCRKVIANVSSGAARKGYAGWSLYCAAKAGMERFIETLAIEQQAEEHPFLPININPGVMDTAMQAAIRAAAPADFPDQQRFIDSQEQGLLVDPARVAERLLQIIAMPELNGGARYNAAEQR
jgi:benzil reductase ((S)-benzoin forming)